MNIMNILWYIVICVDILWYVVICCYILWYVVICCYMLWYVVICCDMLWYVVICCVCKFLLLMMNIMNNLMNHMFSDALISGANLNLPTTFQNSVIQLFEAVCSIFICVPLDLQRVLLTNQIHFVTTRISDWNHYCWSSTFAHWIVKISRHFRGAGEFDGLPFDQKMKPIPKLHLFSQDSPSSENPNLDRCPNFPWNPILSHFCTQAK